MSIPDGYDKKLDDININLNNIQTCLQKLIAYCSDDNAEVRFRSIETLGEVKCQETEEQVIKSLADSDELVRATCLEILGDWKCQSCLELVTEYLDDESTLVKTAAAIALADIGNKRVVNRLKEKIDYLNEEEKISFYYALCVFGQDKYFYMLLNGLFSDFYRIRCIASNLLINLATEKNGSFILNLLKNILENEKSNAVRSSIKNAIKLIEKL